MTVRYIGDSIYKGLSSDTKPTTAVTNALFIETDTRRTFLYDGTIWNTPESFINPYTWFIYKQGSNYKARNGPLGYAPTSPTDPRYPAGAISTSMDEVWAYIRANFNVAGQAANRGGVIKFDKEIFDFTDEMLIDPSVTAITGIIIEGYGFGSVLRFTPTSSLTSAVHIKDLSHSVIRNVQINSANNDVANLLDIHSAGESTQQTLNTLVDNIRTIHTGTARFAGTVGILIRQTGVGGNAMHHTGLRHVYIQNLDTAIDIISKGNASFQTFDDIFIWTPTRGIRTDADTQQSNFSNIRYQAASGGTIGEYVISVKGKYNTINGITVDLITAPNPVVKLEPGAAHNKVSNITNSGSGLHVLDLSGSDTNVGVERTGFSGPLTSKYGEFTGAASTVGYGLLGRGFTAFQSSSARTIGENNFSTNGDIGKSVLLTTNPAINSIIGIISTGVVATRRFNPFFTARWLNTHSANIRFFVGFCQQQFVTDETLPGSSDTVPITTAKACFGVGCRSTDSVYQVIRNDSTGDPVFTDLLQNDGSSTFTIDATTARKLWLLVDNTSGNAYIGMNNHKPNIFNTEIPATDTTLYIVAYIENLQAAQARSITLGKMTLRTVG